MKEKIEFKKRAIVLRKLGRSYNEILSIVPVAKSTLSLWLRDVGLAKARQQILTAKKLAASRRGGEARKWQRMQISVEIKDRARAEIGDLTQRERWLIGIALYWAEGSKEKEYKPGSGAQFTNSDSKMVRFYIDWLVDCCQVNRDDIGFELYIHKNVGLDIDRVKKYWSISTRFPVKRFGQVYWKKHSVKNYKKNKGALYYGNLRVRVKASSALNRKIAGWTQGISG